MSLDLNSPNHIPLNVRIAEFRQDPQNMDQMTEFVDDVIKNAQLEANRRLDEKNKVNEALNTTDLLNANSRPSCHTRLHFCSRIIIYTFLFSQFFSQTDGKKNGKGMLIAAETPVIFHLQMIIQLNVRVRFGCTTRHKPPIIRFEIICF